MKRSCDRWGYWAGAADTDDPFCSCPMCTVRRADRLRKPKGKRKAKR